MGGNSRHYFATAEAEVERDQARVSVDAKRSASELETHCKYYGVPRCTSKNGVPILQYCCCPWPLEPTQNKRSNMQSSYTDLVNTDFLKVLSSFMNIPKFDFFSMDADVGVSAFYVTFWAAVVVGLLYPPYTIKALRQLKAGKLGLDKRGDLLRNYSQKTGVQFRIERSERLFLFWNDGPICFGLCVPNRRLVAPTRRSRL